MSDRFDRLRVLRAVSCSFGLLGAFVPRSETDQATRVRLKQLVLTTYILEPKCDLRTTSTQLYCILSQLMCVCQMICCDGFIDGWVSVGFRSKQPGDAYLMEVPFPAGFRRAFVGENGICLFHVKHWFATLLRVLV